MPWYHHITSSSFSYLQTHPHHHISHLRPHVLHHRPSACLNDLSPHINRRSNPTLDTLSILLSLDLLLPLPPPHHLTSQPAKIPSSFVSLTQSSQALRTLCSHPQQITAFSFLHSRERNKQPGEKTSLVFVLGLQ